MMRIGIYCDVVCHEHPTGIGKHVFELIRALATIDDENQYLLYYPSNLWQKDTCRDLFPKTLNFQARPVAIPKALHHKYPRLWWNWFLPLILRQDKVDIFHGPNHYLPRFQRDRSLVTIHDLAMFKMNVHGASMDRIHRHWIQHAFENAGRIIALSENTKRDCVELGVEEERIEVIHGAGHIVADENIQIQRTAEVRAELRLPNKYVLHVGALQPRKNVPFLVRAFAEFKRQNPTLEHELVLAGPHLNAVDEIRNLARDLEISQFVHMPGYVADWQLPLLYQMADFFVLPSRYEGFGMIAIEAMSYGTPVIAADTSCIREATGDAASLVKVDDVSQLSQAMQKLACNTIVRDELRRKGRTRASQFTWEANAAKTLGVYTAMYQGNVGKPSDGKQIAIS